MASRNLIYTVRPAIGGLNTNSDPTSLDPNELVIADNITYLEGGQRKRRPGVLRYSPSSSSANSTQNVLITSSAAVRALIDTWDYSSGTLIPVQRIAAVVSRSLFRSTGDGNWTVVTGGSSFNGNFGIQMNMTAAQNHVVISNGAMVPIAYNLATTVLVSASAGPSSGRAYPIFEHSVFHQSRLVMGGLSTASSNIVVSAANDIFDSTGTDSVQLPIDPGDGDRVIGISQTFFRNLYVFKGPQYGSIHEIAGNTSTSYVKSKITTGAPAVSHKSIITTPTDIYWMSPYGIHSLQTTLKYGDVDQAYLSLPIQNFWRKNVLVKTAYDNATGFWDPSINVVGWVVAPMGSAIVDGGMYWVLCYNVGLSDPSPGGKKFWSLWKIAKTAGVGFGIRSAAPVISPAGIQTAHVGERRIYFGGDNGIVYQGNYAYFEDDGIPYHTRIQTPIITQFKTPQGTVPATSEKQFTGVVTYYVNNDSPIPSSMNYNAIVDNRPAGGSLLPTTVAGGVLGSFILGLGILGGINFDFAESIIEGRGRGIQLTWANTELDEDFEHLGYSIRFAAAETEPKEAI